MLLERLGIDNTTMLFSNSMSMNPCLMGVQDCTVGDDSTQTNYTNCKKMEEDMSIIENYLQEDFLLQEILKLTNVGDSQIQISHPILFSSSSESNHHLSQRGVDDLGFSAIVSSNCDVMIRNTMMSSSGGTFSSGESENCGSYRSNKEMDFNVSLLDQDVLPQFRCYSTATSSISSKRKENGSVLIDQHSVHLLDSPTTTDSGRFQIQFENYHKKRKLENNDHKSVQSNIDFRRGSINDGDQETDNEAIAHVKEMIYRAAALRPVTLGLEDHVEKPKRRNVKISSDPQTVAARQRRERISERLRVLQKLVPGGTKMDTATMLDEACNYLKFLRSQVCALENIDGKGMKSLTNNINSTAAAATTTFSSDIPSSTANNTCQPYLCNAVSDSYFVS